MLADPTEAQRIAQGQRIEPRCGAAIRMSKARQTG
jgi:hypothetical protein